MLVKCVAMLRARAMAILMKCMAKLRERAMAMLCFLRLLARAKEASRPYGLI